MAWTRYDIYDPWLVKKTNELPERYAVIDMSKPRVVYVSDYNYECIRYMNTLHGNYDVMPYKGTRPNGIQEE